MDEERDCWTCAKFKRVGISHECTADVKGGTMYDGWKPPCANWEPSAPEEKSADSLADGEERDND